MSLRQLVRAAKRTPWAARYALALLRWVAAGVLALSVGWLVLKPGMKILVDEVPSRLLRSSWQKRLYTPTFITKLGAHYFIVDCWHNRILYNRTLAPSLADWQLLDGDLAGPHSIASDTVLYVAEDTGRNSVRVYRFVDDQFVLVQIINGLGRRTHRVRYDPITTAFYVLSSDSQNITKLKRVGDTLRVEYTKNLPFLNHVYTRSMTLLDGKMFFVSGPGVITETRYVDDSYQVLATYPVPSHVSRMNDLAKVGNYYYVSATPRALIRSTSLDALGRNDWEDMYDRLELKGTPYYFAEFDGRAFLPQITEYSGIVSFTERDGRIDDVETHYESGPPNRSDEYVRGRLPK